jgi:hypothetical protein
MFEVKYTTRFKKDYKLLKKRGYDMNKLLDVIDILREGSELPPQYKDHPLHVLSSVANTDRPSAAVFCYNTVLWQKIRQYIPGRLTR